MTLTSLNGRVRSRDSLLPICFVLSHVWGKILQLWVLKRGKLRVRLTLNSWAGSSPPDYSSHLMRSDTRTEGGHREPQREDSQMQPKKTGLGRKPKAWASSTVRNQGLLLELPGLLVCFENPRKPISENICFSFRNEGKCASGWNVAEFVRIWSLLAVFVASFTADRRNKSKQQVVILAGKGLNWINQGLQPKVAEKGLKPKSFFFF